MSLCEKPWTWRGQRSEFTLSLRAGRENGVVLDYLQFYLLVDFSTWIITEKTFTWLIKDRLTGPTLVKTALECRETRREGSGVWETAQRTVGKTYFCQEIWWGWQRKRIGVCWCQPRTAVSGSWWMWNACPLRGRRKDRQGRRGLHWRAANRGGRLGAHEGVQGTARS